MGAIATRPSSGSSYLSVFQGTFRKRMDQPDETTVTRVNRNDKTVHERVYEAFSGFIRDLEFEKSDKGYGWALKIVVAEAGEKTTIVIPRSSDYFRDFAMRLCSIEPRTLLRPVVLNIYEIEDTDKGRKNAFLVPMFYNDGANAYEKVARKYTKDSPGDLPQWEKVVNPKTGDEEWSNLEELKFLSKKLVELIKAAKALMPDESQLGTAPSYGTEKPENVASEAAQAPKEEDFKSKMNQLSELDNALADPGLPPNGTDVTGLDDEDDDLPF